MTAAWLIAAVLLSSELDDPRGATVNQYVDMNGEASKPEWLFAQPLAVHAGLLLNENGAAPVAGASLIGARHAGSWGGLDVLSLSVLSSPTRAGFGGTALRTEQFLCRAAETHAYQPLPFWQEQRDVCIDGEHWGAFVELGRFWARPEDRHYSLRWAEGGVSFDALGNGRTADVRRTRLQVQLGAALDTVWFTSKQDFAPRGVLRVRGTFTDASSRFRALVDLAWRPSVMRFDDHLLEGALTAGVFFVPEVKNALFFRVRARLSVATRRGMATSEWADPSAVLNGMIDLGLEVTFG